MKYPTPGAVLSNQSCTFTVWAPLTKRVDVVVGPGDVHPMAQIDDGFWTRELEGITDGTPYFYLLDGEKKLPDPASRAQSGSVHGASLVTGSAFNWSDEGWSGKALADMIIYELHVATFTSSRNFQGVISRLPYLKDLGVTAIELMPVAQFPGERNWGYDGVFPFAVQDSYGGAQGLKTLVDEAHNAGIAVILDVVYNHLGPEGNYLGEYGPYFTDKYKTGWGKAINFDDAWCDGVRHFYFENALMWLDEFHIDGLRLDAVHAIWDFSARHFIEELTARVHQLEKRTGRKKVLIAEFDLNNPRYIYPPSRGGYGLDGQWVDEFHHALHALLTGEVGGYYEDFGEAYHLAKSLTDGYVYTGQYSKHRKKHFGRHPWDATADQFVVFSQNHDQIGNRMLGDRLSTLLSKEGLKLAAATCLLSPYVPLLFMGEEYGEKNPFLYFISHTDQQLAEEVRKGRREEFSYFQWQGEIPDPQSEKTFENSMLSWDVDTRDEAQVLFSFYRYLIDFRKKRPAMQDRRRDSLHLLSFDQRIISFERKYGSDHLIIVLNFNKEAASFPTPGRHKGRKIFDSSSSQWGGPGRADSGKLRPEDLLHLNPESAVILEFE